jgi:hypothetical protein
MPRALAAVEVSSFVGGLITEASPLTFPENASLDESNFLLNRDGSRSRRLGFDLEAGGALRTPFLSIPSSGKMAFTTFTWENAGDSAERTVIAVQTGRYVSLYDTASTPLSDGYITELALGAEDTINYSYAVVDGHLVVATNDDQFWVVSLNGDSISTQREGLLVRDFFGVEDPYGASLDLKQSVNINKRPATLSDEHLYNVRNQSWGLPRHVVVATGGAGVRQKTPTDPISAFLTDDFNASNAFPSNADTVPHALLIDPSEDSGSGTDGNVFHPRILILDPIGSTEAPSGHFIIDIMKRGEGRAAGELRNRQENAGLIYTMGSIPNDSTDGGFNTVAEFAGRAWFGGFSGEVVDGDSRSPSLSSYVSFSQIVSSISDIGKCYQVADPTNKDDSDLVDNDGGFIRIAGCYGIQAMVNIKTALVIFATNGVWAITGNDDKGFTASSFNVIKISDHGTLGSNSVVLVDSSVIYWGDDGIYQVAAGEAGGVTATNISQSTIQSFYNDISTTAKATAQGVYDSYDRKVRWVYNDLIGDDVDSRELVLDVNLSAFYPSVVGRIGTMPKVVSPFEVPPFKVGEFVDNVTAGGVIVTAGGVNVTTTTTTAIEAVREVMYLVITDIDGGITYGFGTYSNNEFTDWQSIDGTGVDAPAHLVTGYRGEGDFQRYKKAPYLTVHMKRTEFGFELVDGDLVPSNQSSCKVQPQWNWTNSLAAGRWGREFEAYRNRRVYMPTGISDDFDDGELVLSTRNKLRGKGKVLSLSFRTEPKKDLQLLGWSMLLGANSNV